MDERTGQMWIASKKHTGHFISSSGYEQLHSIRNRNGNRQVESHITVQILLFIGPVVLHSRIQKVCYDNLLILYVGIQLLANPKTCTVYNALNLLVCFVTHFKTLDEQEFFSYNVHCLVHLAHDVCHFEVWT